MQSHFKLDAPATARLPKYTARAAGCHLCSGDDLQTVALRGSRLAFPGSDLCIYQGLRLVAVVALGPVDLYTPDELAAAAALRDDASTSTVVSAQEVG